MKNIILLTGFVFVLSNNMFAQQVTIDEAKQAASVAMYIFGKDKSINNIENNILKINTMTDKGTSNINTITEKGKLNIGTLIIKEKTLRVFN